MGYQNKIIEYGVKKASQFTVNPNNFTEHPAAQRAVMNGVLTTVGFVAAVIENRRTGYLVDGHERVWEALQNNDSDVPYLLVDLTEEEELLLIATMNETCRMGTIDSGKAQEILKKIGGSTNMGVTIGLAELAKRAGMLLGGRGGESMGSMLVMDEIRIRVPQDESRKIMEWLSNGHDMTPEGMGVGTMERMEEDEK